MSRLRISFFFVVLLLFVTNALWAYAGLDPQEPVKQRINDDANCYPDEVAKDMYHDVVRPLVAATNAALERGATRDLILDRARTASGRNSFCMEQDGVEKVGDIGLRFDASGRLTGVSITSCPP